jgi:hypothetical protein
LAIPGVFCSWVVAGTRWFRDEEVAEDGERYFRVLAGCR